MALCNVTRAALWCRLTKLTPTPHGCRLAGCSSLENAESCNSFGNSKGCDGMGPLVLYSNSSPPISMVISALDEVLVHQATAENGSISFGLRATLEEIPEGFMTSTIMVGGTGITDTMRGWGQLLLRSRG